MTLLEVDGLNVEFATRDAEVHAARDVSFSVAAGETLAIVGESGSGKSVSCMGLLGLLPAAARVQARRAQFAGRELLQLSGVELRALRGREIGVIFQDPMTSLNPYLSIGQQLVEPLLLHRLCGRAEAKRRALAGLQEVGIDKPALRYDQYPFELSGGMRQRVLIAMALIAEPRLLIADEPTTALDVTIQAQVLELLQAIQARRQLAVIFVSHDLAVVANIADRVMVMQRGQVVEAGSCLQVLQQPEHDYTRSLLAAVPSGAKLAKGAGQSQVLVEVRQLRTWFKPAATGWFGRTGAPHKAVDDISFELARGEVVGLVGESGSGKSTTARSLLGLAPVTSGTVKFDGVELSGLSPKRMRQLRAQMQMVFQDPYASLNPRMTVFECLAEPLLHFGLADRRSVLEQVLLLLDDVGLARSQLHKYPHQFSGGQRQRIAIARALAPRPDFVIADEPVSALDVTIQEQILELLQALVSRRGLAMLFISHDLAVVRRLCDRVLVMHRGQLLESGPVETVYNQPQHSYTRSLLAAVPTLPHQPQAL